MIVCDVDGGVVLVVVGGGVVVGIVVDLNRYNIKQRLVNQP